MRLFNSPLFVNLIYLCVVLCGRTCASILSARCRSRCFAKQEIQRPNITTIPVLCTTQGCSACWKPCARKTEVLSCSSLCGSYLNKDSKSICRDSCKFLKHLHLEDGNSSCPTGVPNRQCVLMRPENVQVSFPDSRNKKSQNYTISWNGTWPSSTVFVVMVKKQTKSSSSSESHDNSHDWMEIKQTTLQSIRLDLQPLVWYQFKVAAVNQYGASSYGVPSKFIFTNPKHPGPPRGFKVTAMYKVKGHVNVDVSWKKPDSAIGLPIHRYKLQWSPRHDQHLEEMVSIRVEVHRVQGNVHQFVIKQLLPNTTYVLELQAISRWGERRLRSRWVILRIRTPAIEKEPKEPTKKVKSKGNQLVILKKKMPKPTAFTVEETNPTERRSSRPTTVTPSNKKKTSPKLALQQSDGGVMRISWQILNASILLALTVIFDL